MPAGTSLFVEVGYKSNLPVVLESEGPPACAPDTPQAIRRGILQGQQLKKK
jgi:hypothetical protein